MSWTNRDPHEHHSYTSAKKEKKSTKDTVGEFLGMIFWYIVGILALAAIWYLLRIAGCVIGMKTYD
jgi:hypothetical protein